MNDATPDGAMPLFATRHIALVGMMGSGKSSVGRALAHQLGRPFVDTDARIVVECSSTIAELFVRCGEAAFRDIEAAVVERACDDATVAVIALGGGAVLRPDTRSLLSRRCVVVWLRATTDTLIERIATGPVRPLLADDPAASVLRIDAERRVVYGQSAQVTVDVDGLHVGQVVECVRAGLEHPASSP